MFIMVPAEVNVSRGIMFFAEIATFSIKKTPKYVVAFFFQ